LTKGYRFISRSSLNGIVVGLKSSNNRNKKQNRMAMDKEQRDRIQRASTYKNTKVKNAAGEKVGKVEDIMLNTATGEISYVVLAVDTGFLNMDSKYFAVPWQALKFDTAQEDVFILNVEKEKLKNAPGFDKDNWPD